MSVSFVAVCLWCFTNSVLICAKPKEPFPLGLMKRHPFQFVGAGIAGILVAPQQQVVLRFAICCAGDAAAMFFFWFVLPVCEILKELLRLLCGSPGCSFDCFWEIVFETMPWFAATSEWGMFVHLPVQEILLEKRQAQAVLGDKQARTCHEFPAVSCQQIPCDRHVQLKEDDEESGMLHSKTVQKHGYGMLWVIIHPASRGVAAHTAGLFRSVRGAKGGFPPWGLPKLRIFTFPPRGGSPS